MWRSIAPHDHDKMQFRQPPVGYKERTLGGPVTRRGGERKRGGAMGEEASVPIDTNLTSSSSARFLGPLKQPDSDPYPNLEFDESDVVWSSSFSSASDFSSASSSPSVAGPTSYSPSESYRHRRPETRPFVPERSGLLAALAVDSLPLVRQRGPAAEVAARRSVPVPVAAGRAGAEAARGGMAMGKGFHQSAPVNVPAWPSWRRGGSVEAEDGKEQKEDEEEEEEEMVPPHVIVARSHVMTFSVFEGVGRTLKGRDLRRVRNAVLQKTGFL